MLDKYIHKPYKKNVKVSSAVDRSLRGVIVMKNILNVLVIIVCFLIAALCLFLMIFG